MHDYKIMLGFAIAWQKILNTVIQLIKYIQKQYILSSQFLILSYTETFKWLTLHNTNNCKYESIA